LCEKLRQQRAAVQCGDEVLKRSALDVKREVVRNRDVAGHAAAEQYAEWSV